MEKRLLDCKRKTMYSHWKEGEWYRLFSTKTTNFGRLWIEKIERKQISMKISSISYPWICLSTEFSVSFNITNILLVTQTKFTHFLLPSLYPYLSDPFLTPIQWAGLVNSNTKIFLTSTFFSSPQLLWVRASLSLACSIVIPWLLAFLSSTLFTATPSSTREQNEWQKRQIGPPHSLPAPSHKKPVNNLDDCPQGDWKDNWVVEENIRNFTYFYFIPQNEINY